jgi:eukaryotic-like serine/threonine-protein kinase
MACPHCGSTAQAVRGRCGDCGAAQPQSPIVAAGVLTPVPPAAAGATPPIVTPSPASEGETRFDPSRSPTVRTQSERHNLSVGQDFGARYHIIRLLGAGGMGAVYQAWDKVLEVAVAVKVVRPDATLDEEAARRLEKRFKRELLLARQVTHTNVVRIHDLGEIDGILYITMPYVQGSDLASILKREGRLPIDRAVAIATQVASGLAAAHQAGVVHRDLKPANIMVDAEDHALIMDFGIARSTEGATVAAMTAVGAVVGTMEYMAPEQANGLAVDQRADIYSFGLIVHDMLLGRRHAGPSTAVVELLARMQRPPASLRSVDLTMPEWLDALVTKCLQPDPSSRYQTMKELLVELGQPQSATRTATMPLGPVLSPVVAGRRPTRKWIVGVSLLVALAAGGWFFRDRFDESPAPSPSVEGPAISLAILPFRNASGDPALDSLGPSLSQVLGTTLGQSSHVRTVPSDRLHQVLQDLRIGANANLTPVELSRVADFTTARRVLWGQYTRFGNAIRLDATLQDLDRGDAVPLNAMAPNEASLLPAIAELADAVRQNLARGSPDILNELKSTAWKPSTASFDALRLYNEGVQFTQQGTHQGALKSFEAATKADGNFALAFSALAQSYATLGYDTEAAQHSRRAMSLADALPPQEKHRIAANHYRIVNDTDKAIESYENLVKASPDDAMVRFELGGLYEQQGALDQAREHFAKLVERDPKFVEGLLALGRVEIRRGNPQPSLEHLDKALSLAIQLDKTETRGNVLQAIGIAYMRLNRPTEALKRYEESLEIKQRLGNKRGMAASYVQIGEVQKTLGNPRAAEQSYRAAEKLRREIGDKGGLSLTLIDLAALLNDTFGRARDALPILQEALTIARDTGNRNLEARALNNIGSLYMSQGQYSDAQTYFERALELREKAKAPQEMADTLHNLGETYTRMGRYEQALQQFVRALELRRSANDRRSAAIEAYGIGSIFDYQGRYGAAVKSKEEALQAFRDLNQRDVWLAEILSGYGSSLSLSGRTAEALSHLQEAQNLANELKNASLVAQTLRYQAERLYYSGDVNGAVELAEQSAEAAARASNPSLTLFSQANVAIIASVARPTQALARTLAGLAQQADAQGLESLSVECAVQRAETLMKIGDQANALPEAERALAKAEELGLKVPLAKAHYLKASLLRLKSDSDARREYAAALRVLEEIKADEGNQNVLKRADLAALHADATKWVKAPGGT